MNVREEIEAAIASLCGDICRAFNAEENKTRAYAVAYLVATLCLAPKPEEETEV